jgi:hypothetical protein
VEDLAKINGTEAVQELPTYGSSDQTGRAHIEVDARGYHYVVQERGEEFQRRTTQDVDVLLYWIFDVATFSLAMRHATKHRVPAKDDRRILFPKQAELLAQLKPHWGDWARAQHLEILERHPFDDWGTERAVYSAQLRKGGTDPNTAWKLACDKWPLPVPIRRDG